MKTFGAGSSYNTYEGRNFALSSIGNVENGFLNVQIEGIHERLDSRQDYLYSDGVWVTMRDDDVDELITALQYWQKYKTFNKED